MENNIVNAIYDIITQAEKFKHSYFFTSPGNASSRRSYEKYNSRDEIQWNDGKDTFTARFDVSCSCNNVYAKGYYTRNGKNTTLTAVKNSYNRLTKAEESSRKEGNKVK